MKRFKVLLIIMSVFCIMISYTGCGCDDGSSQNGNVDDIITTNEVTPESVSLTCNVPAFEYETVQTPAGNFSRIKSGNPYVKMRSGGNGNYSKPEVPVTVFFLAFPFEATAQDVVINVTPAGGREMNNLKPYPVQKPKRDLIGADDDESFIYDESAYLSSTTLVRNAELSRVGGIDDANIWKITVNLMDYDPKMSRAILYDKLNIDVSFTGKTDCYTVRRVPVDQGDNAYPIDDIDQWLEEDKSSVKKINVKNEVMILDEAYRGTSRVFAYTEGARFIILTDSDFVGAANRLRDHKESIGISTSVILTSAIPGSAGGVTDELIRDFLVTCYNTWAVQPRWVLLVGDVEFIPTHYDTEDNFWDEVPNSGDIYYGQIHDDPAELPVFGIGRLPVDTEGQAKAIVDKIITYETSPPAIPMIGDSYYSRLTFAAEFQDVDDDHPVADGRAVRWFAETSEHIRDYMTGLHFDVERIYKASSAHDPLFWEDGTAVPSYLRRPAFAWDGDRFDIINAVNNGTSILYHRDHGYYGGWGTPGFTSADLPSITITDNQFPVVYSINCSSGYFDNETQLYLYGTNSSTVAWAERFIRNEHGAIGIICDTRGSDTVLNNSFVKGLFDASWPSYLSYGSGTSIRKLGDVLNHAKGYVASCGFGELDERQEIIIYNLLGDPTIEVKSKPPIVMEVTAPTWASRSVIDLPFRIPDPSDLIARGTPVFAVVVEPVTQTVVGRALVSSKVMSGNNTVSIPIDEQKLGTYNDVEIYLSGSDVKMTMVEAEFN